MSRIGIMQPYLFPYLGYYQLIDAVDTFVAYDNFDFIKNGWINRNRILNANGQPMYFTVPIHKKIYKRKINEITIESDYWRKKLIKSIILSYRKSPHFEEVLNLIKPIIEYQTDSISVLSKLSLEKICNFIGITEPQMILNPDLNWLEDKIRNEELQDIKDKYRIDQSLTSIKLIRVIAICRYYNARTFINPIGGKELYRKADFSINDLKVQFLTSNDIVYPQRTKEFVPNLSIIDVLMNCGKDKIGDLLKERVLV